MSTTQKSLLLCSAVCFVLILFNIWSASFWLAVIFFLLHCVSLLSFTCLCYTSAPDQADSARYGQLKTEYDQLSSQCEDWKAQAEKAKSASLELERTRAELEQTRNLLTAMENQAASAEETFDSQKALYESLLPPLKDGPSDEPIDLIRTVRNVIGEFTPFSRQAGIQIHISSTEESLALMADTERIRILFRNIIDNSIKYMKRPGSLTITISTLGDDVFIVLKDDGEGLPAEETTHVFEMNFQGSNRVSGNGLGLTQAKVIVEAYGGTIYAKSSQGKGMGIYIQIPVR